MDKNLNNLVFKISKDTCVDVERECLYKLETLIMIDKQAHSVKGRAV